MSLFKLQLKLELQSQAAARSKFQRISMREITFFSQNGNKISNKNSNAHFSGWYCRDILPLPPNRA